MVRILLHLLSTLEILIQLAESVDLSSVGRRRLLVFCNTLDLLQVFLRIARVINSELPEITYVLTSIIVKRIQLRLPGQDLLPHLLFRLVCEQIVHSALVLSLFIALDLFVDYCLVGLCVQLVAFLSPQVVQL